MPPNPVRRWNLRRIAPLFLLAGGLLAPVVVYASTLQTHVSGSFQEGAPGETLKNEYIKDVAEIQVALNHWGTIHFTGYPLYAMIGNLFTLPLRAVGVEPAAAASLYAAAWGMIALGAFGLLVWRLTASPVAGASGIVLLAVTRSIWIHNVVAEVYGMSLALTVLMFLVALWPAAWSARRRLLALALLIGIGVAHHRAVAFVIPGLVLAAWPSLRAEWDHGRSLAPWAVGLALLGFVPYLYLPLRAWQGADWVYGEPGTVRGFWEQFTGKEADWLVTPPSNLAGLWDNVQGVWNILADEILLPGLLIGVISLALAAVISPQRRAARAVALGAAGPALFSMFFFTAVLPQAILMPVVMALVFGVALMVGWLSLRWRWGAAAVIGVLVWAGALIGWHSDYVRELVSQPGGLDTIARLERLPHEGKPALMLPWGPHYAAVAYAKLVTGELSSLEIVDHKGDYRALLAGGYDLYTMPETFYTYPPPWPTDYGPPSDWWTTRLGNLFLSSAVPGLIQLRNTPWLSDPADSLGTPVVYGITRRTAWLTCDEQSIFLHVLWSADSPPSGDPSIFVHLTGDELAPDPPNADTRHPVYGLYPFEQWSPGEIARDDFTLPRLPDKTQVRFGLYEQETSGQFVNYGETILPVAACETVPD